MTRVRPTSDTADVEARLDQLEQENLELRQLIAELGTAPRVAAASSAPMPSGPAAAVTVATPPAAGGLSRRRLMRTAGTAALAGAGLAVGRTLLRSSPANAQGSNAMLVDTINTGTAITSLTSSGGKASFHAENTGQGIALHGNAHGGGISVLGEKDAAGEGIAVMGSIDRPTSAWPAVAGNTMGTGPAVQGIGYSTGAGVLGEGAKGPGVVGSSLLGRGGVFSGGRAQLQLQPSAANSHPRSGRSGDLFVDKSHRLWFCKGGSTWMRLA